MTTDEARKIARGLFPGANYLIRLRQRMTIAGFLPTDPVFKLVIKAQDLMQEICTEVDYAGCDSGVGRRSDGK
jgi:hypothetical protein